MTTNEPTEKCETERCSDEATVSVSDGRNEARVCKPCAREALRTDPSLDTWGLA